MPYNKLFLCLCACAQVICVEECPTSTSYEDFICQYDLQDAVDADSTGITGLYYCATYQVNMRRQVENILILIKSEKEQRTSSCTCELKKNR